MEEFDSFIFDLDGTLWDSVDVYIKGWNNIFLRENIPIRFDRRYFERMVGWNPSDFLRAVLPDYSQQYRERLYCEASEEQLRLYDTSKAFIYPGVIEGLKLLNRSYRLFIVSNCSKGIIEKFFQQTNTGYCFTGNISHGDNGLSKSENIKYIVNKHNLKKTVYVGDTVSDKTQSELANVDFIWVSYGFGFVQDYEKMVNCFSELVSLCQIRS
ncbi:HAD family hydrolase [Marinilabilia rubra]|uniref:phosphoglycolate phosphatase n=1 Tax=Marinilabilia rubra TaxID=2162893 RepID=A0A2U2BC08_9BACT|nr:HAD family hydrolase [Marinilabilia rubra]PWE00605.1 hypothetical protein DDZ16_03120 [Marinilabilia rubra]